MNPEFITQQAHGLRNNQEIKQSIEWFFLDIATHIDDVHDKRRLLIAERLIEKAYDVILGNS